MNDPREVPHLRWRSDGIGNIRMYHAECPGGRNISDPDEYHRLIEAGWCHCPENVSSAEGSVIEVPLTKEGIQGIDDKIAALDEIAVEMPAEKPKKKKSKKKSGNSFATQYRDDE